MAAATAAAGRLAVPPVAGEEAALESVVTWGATAASVVAVSTHPPGRAASAAAVGELRARAVAEEAERRAVAA